mgnify:CR=1 FL=1
MCIRDRHVGDGDVAFLHGGDDLVTLGLLDAGVVGALTDEQGLLDPVSYTHLRAHETVLDLVCRLLLEKKKRKQTSARNTH